MRLIHCMKKKEYLISSLKNGLMPTNHPVEFNISNNTECVIYQEIFQMLCSRLNELGTPWDTINENEQNILCLSVTNILSEAKMICFTELTDGRDLNLHRGEYGSFGIVVNSAWVESKGGDRVLYIGNQSEASLRLFKAFAAFRIRGIFLDKNGRPNPNTGTMEYLLDLLPFMQKRDNIAEQEWRIADKCADKLNNIPIKIQDIQTIYVPDDETVKDIQDIITEINPDETDDYRSKVMVFPKNIPSE